MSQEKTGKLNNANKKIYSLFNRIKKMVGL